jgi:hypothetical protein
VLWPLPLLTVSRPVLRLRAICEHGAALDLPSPRTAARCVRFMLFAHHVNFHVAHHLRP